MKTVLKHVVGSLGYSVMKVRPEAPIDPRIPALIEAMWPVTTDIALIRAGGDSDGAYLVPDDLDGIAALFSPGVDQVAGFEEDMAARGMECYLADASVEAPPIANPRFHFDKKFVGITNDDSYMTLDSWVDREQPGDHDLMLQMDIEGGEWLALASASDRLLTRFRVIVIELHSIGQLLYPFQFSIIAPVLERLLVTHHVVHNHPNNVSSVARHDAFELPDLLEVTFLRKDRARATGFARTFPHPLDITRNVDTRPPLALPGCWHG